MQRIKGLHAENFLAFKEVDFDFDDVGMVLVEGRNGAGKSAMVDALLWCLFGKTLRGYEHDDVIHRRVKEGCLVTVDLVDNAGPWSVTRARRHPRLKNSLIVTDGSGSGYVYATDKGAQDDVERRLGCSYKTFLSSVVFGQDRSYRFSSLTDAEQKKILDEVLGVERFAQACALARVRASASEAAGGSDRQSLAQLRRQVVDVTAEVVDLKVKDADFVVGKKARLSAEEAKLDKVKAELNKMRRVYDVDALKELLSAAQGKVTSCERKVSKAAEVDSEAGAAVTVAKRRCADLGKLIEARESASGDCPTCGQKVDARQRKKVLSELRAELEEAEKDLARTESDARGAALALRAATAKLKEARAAVAEAQKAYDAGVAVAVTIASLNERREAIVARIDELTFEANPYTKLVEKAVAKQRRLSEEAAQLEARVAEADKEVARVQFWVKAFGASGLRSLLVDSSLPLLNEEAGRVSRALTGGDIRIEFSAQSEQKSGKVVDRFEVRVDNRHGAGDYAGNSSGERAKVDLCVGLALQRLVASRSSASFNLAVYDEVFDHVDSASHERVIDVLSTLDKDSVLVISHDEDLQAWFPASWRFAKRGDFSVVEV